MRLEKRRFNVRKLTIIGILGAVSIILGMTPLGFIPVGPTKATIMHIPVIIGAIMEGPIVGMAIGLIFGLFSMINAVTRPTPVSFVFLNPIISILPRVLMGYLTYKVYSYTKDKKSKYLKGILNISLAGLISYLIYSVVNLVKTQGSTINIILNIIFIGVLIILTYYLNKQKDELMAIILSAATGTLINTIGVLSSIYFLYGERYVAQLGQSANLARKIIFGIAVTNGIPEVILAVIITVSVINSLRYSRS